MPEEKKNNQQDHFEVETVSPVTGPAGLVFLTEQMNKQLQMIPPLDVNEAIRRICAEMDEAPKIVDDYAYTIPYWDNELKDFVPESDLSINGALVCRDKAAELGFIIVLDPWTKEETEEQITIQAKARRVLPCGVAPNLKTGQMEQFNITVAESPGYKRVSKVGIKRDGTEFQVPFALEKVVSLAYRNAILNLFPDKVRYEVLAHALKSGRVTSKDIPTRRSGFAASESAGKNEETKWKDRNKAMFAELKKKYPDDWEPRYRKLLKDEFKVESTKELNLFQLDVIMQKIKAGALPEPDQQENLV
jgi:hypothetical protein